MHWFKMKLLDRREQVTQIRKSLKNKSILNKNLNGHALFTYLGMQRLPEVMLGSGVVGDYHGGKFLLVEDTEVPREDHQHITSC